MKYLIYIVIVQSILVCTSCILHSSSKLMKRMECSEIKTITLCYEYSSRLKLQNIPSTRNYYGKWVSPYYQIKLTVTDIENFKAKFCPLIDSLKSSAFYRKYHGNGSSESIKKYGMNIDALKLFFAREKDVAFIDVLSQTLLYSSFHEVYITHSDPLWTYSSERYFYNKGIRKALVLFANEIILYKNEQIKNDATILDSLRIMYPLINYDSL